MHLMLLARMGVPLAQAKENWNCMDNTIKEQFQKNVNEIAQQFGLNDVSFPSFILVRPLPLSKLHYFPPPLALMYHDSKKASNQRSLLRIMYTPSRGTLVRLSVS
jgi:hypothetical protein